MIPSLPLLSCESSVFVKENPDRKKVCKYSKVRLKFVGKIFFGVVVEMAASDSTKCIQAQLERGSFFVKFQKSTVLQRQSICDGIIYLFFFCFIVILFVDNKENILILFKLNPLFDSSFDFFFCIFIIYYFQIWRCSTKGAALPLTLRRRMRQRCGFLGCFSFSHFLATSYHF